MTVLNINKKETVCSEKNIYPPDYFICFILLFYVLFYYFIPMSTVWAPHSPRFGLNNVRDSTIIES